MSTVAADFPPEPHDIRAEELAARIGTADEPFVLDVREKPEFEEWAIGDSTNIPLGELARRTGDLPTDRDVVVVCASGVRSARAADLLVRSGLQAASLRGGMAAWGAVSDHVVVELGHVRAVQVRRRGKGCLSYVLGSRHGSEAFVVDPSLDADTYRAIAAEHSWRITRVFDTHLHADHVSGARRLAAREGAVLHLNPADAFAFPYEPLRDGDRFRLGDDAGLTVAAFGTPGHTLGSTVYFVDDRAVLTGDTLFVDGVGRPDLAERAAEFARTLFRSLHERILTLPRDTLVLPGHYGERILVRPGEPVATTVAELLANLPVLDADEAEFVSWATARATPRPPNYAEIIMVNMGREDLDDESLRQLELGPNRCSV